MNAVVRIEQGFQCQIIADKPDNSKFWHYNLCVVCRQLYICESCDTPGCEPSAGLCSKITVSQKTGRST
jgi:hypothetical protein